MTPERFAELLEIYGAEPRRWPEGERRQAIAYLESHRDEAEAALEAARKLDRALDQHRVRAERSELARRIIATAPSLRIALQRARIWRLGAGFAALGLAGALAGALAIAVLMPMSLGGDNDGGAYALTAFNDLAQTTDD